VPKVAVEVVGNDASFNRVWGRFLGSLKVGKRELGSVSVAAEKTARAQVEAALKSERRLRQNAAAARQLAASYARGSRERLVADRLAAQADARLSRSLAVSSSEAATLDRRLRRAGAGARLFGRDIGKAERGLLAGSGLFRRFGRSLAYASTFFIGGAGIGYGLEQAVTGGANLERQLSRTETVFGRFSGTVKAWSKTTAAGFEVGRREALAFASTLGSVLERQGVKPRRAAAISKLLVRRAGEVAETTPGTSTEEIVNALSGALVGRALALRKATQGTVVVTPQKVKAEAARLGLLQQAVETAKVRDATDALTSARIKAANAEARYGKDSLQAFDAQRRLRSAEEQLSKARRGSRGVLTDNARALAVFSLFLKQTETADRRAAKTSGQFERQLGKLKAEAGDLRDEIGVALIPQLRLYVHDGATWLGQNKNQERVLADVKTAAHALGSAIKIGAAIVHDATPLVHGITDAFGGLKNTLELIAAVKVARWASRLVGSLGGIGAAAGEKGAAGEVGVLVSRLAALKTIGTITIPIVIALQLDEHKQGIFDRLRKVDKLDEWLGKHIPGYAAGNRAAANAEHWLWGVKPPKKPAARPEAPSPLMFPQDQFVAGGSRRPDDRGGPRTVGLTRRQQQSMAAEASAADLLGRLRGSGRRGRTGRALARDVAALRVEASALRQALRNHRLSKATRKALANELLQVEQGLKTDLELIAQRVQAAFELQLARFALAESRAQLTAGLGDDMAVLQREEGFFKRLLANHKLSAAKRVDLEQQLVDVEIHARDLQQQQAEQGQQAMEDALTRRLQLFDLAASKAALVGDDMKVLRQEETFLKQQLRNHQLSADRRIELAQQLVDIEQRFADRFKEALDQVRSIFGDLFQGPVLQPSDEDRRRMLGFPGVTIDKLTADLKAQIRKFEQFERLLAKLRRRGAPRELISELQQQGEAALPELEALANAPRKKLEAFLRQFEQREKLLRKAANVSIQAASVTVKADKVIVGHSRGGGKRETGFAGGGVVGVDRRPPGPGDTEPAWLKRNELVLDLAQQRGLGRLLGVTGGPRALFASIERLSSGPVARLASARPLLAARMPRPVVRMAARPHDTVRAPTLLAGGGGGDTITITINGANKDPNEIADAVLRKLQRRGRKSSAQVRGPYAGINLGLT
jgi:hypothetical protein